MTSTPLISFLRGLGLTAIAASVFLLSGQAQAEKRCTSKPAVCMRLKAQAAHKAAQPKPAPSQQKAEKRCTSKPAVCMRLKAQEAARVEAGVEPPRFTPRPQRCTTKPAICMRLKKHR